MLARIIAAAMIVLVGAAVAAPASAEPRGRGQQSRRGNSQRGRSRQWQGRRQYWHPGRGWDYNPLPGFLGGLFGGWLGQQLNQDD